MIYQDRLHDVKAICYSAQFKKSKYILSFFYTYFCKAKYTTISKEISPFLIIVVYVNWVLFCWEIPFIAKKDLQQFASKMALKDSSPSPSLSMYCEYFLQVFHVCSYFSSLLSPSLSSERKIHKPWIICSNNIFNGLFGSSSFLPAYTPNHQNVWSPLELTLSLWQVNLVTFTLSNFYFSSASRV